MGRYYAVDETYNKHVYENTRGNVVMIVLALCGFWLFNAAHWWGVFALGIVHA